MSLSVEETRIKGVLKGMMKKRGLHHADLAEALGVSVPTVRRFMTKEHLSVERLVKVCEWLGVSFYEVVEMSRTGSPEVNLLSEEQEEFFAAFPRYFTYLRYLGRGLTPAEIETKYSLKPTSTQWYLTELEAHGLIAVNSAGAVRFLVKWPPALRFPGPLQKKFFRATHRKLIDHLEDLSVSKRQIEDGFYFMIDSVMLKDETYRQYMLEMKALFEKYTSIGRLEAQTSKPGELQVAAAVLGAARMDPLTAAMGDVCDVP